MGRGEALLLVQMGQEDKSTSIPLQHGPVEIPPLQGDGAMHHRMAEQAGGMHPLHDLGVDGVWDK